MFKKNIELGFQMNEMKSGLLITVVATFITSILILNTSPSVAEDKNTVSNKPLVSADLENVAVQKEVEAVTSINNVNAVQLAAANTSDLKRDFPAPEGLYKQKNSSTVVENTSPDRVEEVQEYISYEPFFSEGQSIPQIYEKRTPVAAKPKNSKPIWMEQKLGIFKSADNLGSEGSLKMVTNISNGLQGENPEQVMTTKHDRFNSIEVFPEYNYQQMPMYNGGYYIAPMPAYLMSSTLPSKAVIKKRK